MPLTAEFHAACEQLQPIIQRAQDLTPQVAADLLQLNSRHEQILLMPRYGGKSKIGLCSGFTHNSVLGSWRDEHENDTKPELVRTITGMLKIYREARSQFPDYNPKITLRPETWADIKTALYWVEPHMVANLAFPKQAFYNAFRVAGASNDAMMHFGPDWLDTFCDSANRLYPGLAFDALKRTVQHASASRSMTYAKWRGAAEACAEFVSQQSDICYWVTLLADNAAATIKGNQCTVLRERAILRFKQAKRRSASCQLPYDLSGPKFIRYVAEAGIWRSTKQAYLHFATPYSIGAAFLKARLTDDAFERMLSR